MPLRERGFRAREQGLEDLAALVLAAEAHQVVGLAEGGLEAPVGGLEGGGAVVGRERLLPLAQALVGLGGLAQEPGAVEVREIGGREAVNFEQTHLRVLSKDPAGAEKVLLDKTQAGIVDPPAGL